jgi:hypothetical protein
MSINSAEIIAELAPDYLKRLQGLGVSITREALVDGQIAPALLTAVLKVNEGERVTPAMVRGYEQAGGTDHLDPTLTGSPIASERPYSSSNFP